MRQDVRRMRYIDRKGNITIEESGRDRLIRHLYEDWGGRLCLKIIVRPFISRLAGWFLDSGISKGLIPGFVKRNRIDLSEYEEKNYTSYNDFFTRKQKPEARPVAKGDKILVSPCDGKATVCRIGRDSRFFIKDMEYTLDQLLRNSHLTRRYQGGYAVIFRLTVEDCHRYCYVADGWKSPNVYIRGRLYPVGQAAQEDGRAYVENTREYTLLKTSCLGTVLMMEVGALLVGKIHNFQKDACAVKKGQEKGFFAFGGSTVVLLLQPDKVRLDFDLVENSENGYETLVKMGERIGEQKLSKRTGKASRQRTE